MSLYDIEYDYSQLDVTSLFNFFCSLSWWFNGKCSLFQTCVSPQQIIRANKVIEENLGTCLD